MHPVLARRVRLDLYLAAWLPVAVLLAAALAIPVRRPWWEAAALGLPMALVAAFMSLAQWPMCRALPLHGSQPVRFATSHLASLAVSVGVWLLVGAGVAAALERLPGFDRALERYRLDAPNLSVLGALLFVVVTMLHYLMITFEDAREAERSALEATVQMRDAELRALRAQLNPHFLYNGLNAVASLAGTDPVRARAMCVMLADFLRRSLALGGQAEIPLAQELDLADRYLAIEQVRFGDRLRVERDVDQAAGRCLVPALLLQPLVENAVTHGIAHSLGGGIVRLTARRAAGRLDIALDNPAEADRPEGRGAGLGLANVRSRLASMHPGAMRVECRESDGRFSVQISLPAVERALDRAAIAGAPDGAGAAGAPGAAGGVGGGSAPSADATSVEVA